MAGPGLAEPDYASPGRDWKPVPDPTELTQQAVDRAITNFREYVDTKFQAMNRATELNATKVERWEQRAELDREKAAADVERQLATVREFTLERIAHVSDVAAEKINGLERMLAERDERVRQAAAEANTGLTAALTAQSAIAAQDKAATSLASNKQEVGFQKLLDQQAATSRAEIEALKNQVADLKDRLGRAETLAAQALTASSTRIEVKSEGKTDNRALANIGIAIVSIILSVVLALTLKKG
jgi:hypothetical protein